MDKVRPCYEKDGAEKLACFRRLAGLSNAALNGQGVKKDEMRLYTISLFNDLQLRIEQLNAEGSINNQTAVAMIDKITQINEKLIAGENASQIKPLVKELKALWKNARVTQAELKYREKHGLDDDSDDDEDSEDENDDNDQNETESDDDDDSSNNVTDDDDDEEDDEDDDDDNVNITIINNTQTNNTGDSNESN